MAQFIQVSGINGVRNWTELGEWGIIESGKGFFNFIGAPHGDHLIADFVVLQWAEAILTFLVNSKILLRSEERNNIV